MIKDISLADAIKKYKPSELEDDEKHDTEIESMFYIDKLQHILVIEKDSKRFKVYDAVTGQLHKKYKNVPDKKSGDFGGVIAAELVEHGNSKYIFTTHNDNTICKWDKDYVSKGKISTSDI
jgi:hypothetical protein